MNTSAPQAAGAPSALLLGLEPTRALLHLVHAKFFGAGTTESEFDGKGRPVVVIPGLGCNHLTTGVLRSELAACNYRVEDWGGGVNVGPQGDDLETWLAPLRETVERLAAETGKKVSLVGWSLGGIAARELSRMKGVPVAKVVTLGTPFSDLHATNAGGAYKLLNRGQAALSDELAATLSKEPPVPGASIYSLSDGIVQGEACKQHKPRRTRNVEVSSASHFGMVLCPKVARAVLEELGR